MTYIIKKNLNMLRLNSERVLNIESLYYSKKQVRIKFGVDPTKPYITAGHFLFLNKLKMLCQGTTVIIIIGVFTSSVGDPTGRSKERPIMKKKHAFLNAEVYLKRIKLFFQQKNKIKVYMNLWLGYINIGSFFKFIGDFNISCILNRLDFKNRFLNKTGCSLKEVIYPTLQSYDSFQIHSNIEIGGDDQLLNILLVRLLQRKNKVQGLQCTVTLPLLLGIDGSLKMSKGCNNYILMDGDLHYIYEKLNSIKHKTLANYFRLLLNSSETILLKLYKYSKLYLKEVFSYILLKNFFDLIKRSSYENLLVNQVRFLTYQSSIKCRVKVVLYDKISCNSYVSIFQVLKQLSNESSRGLRRLIFYNNFTVLNFSIKNFFKKLIRSGINKFPLNLKYLLNIILIN
jgi:tyrosyl-tRNA synthetase